MRKIYSILLMACSMLISANIQAQNVAKIVGGDEYATVEEAFADAAADGGTIQLIGAAAEVLQNEVIVIKDGQELTLDLNGKTLVYGRAESAKTAANPQNFVLTNGNLTIKNGTVKNETPVKGDFKNNSDKQIIICYMAGDENETTTNYTKLKVEADAMLYTEKGKAAIVIDGAGASAFSGYGKNSKTNKTFGVVVDVYGTTYGDKYGIQISGNLAGYDANDPGAPFIHVYPGALVYANPNATTGCGIYMGGVGVCVIEGTVHGATGLYVKSGKVDINNATIYSDATEYTAAVGTNSGAHASGSAIVVESNKGYTGHHDVTISGDSKITGNGGYGIEETITTSDTTKVTSIKFVGGTIESGSQGAIVVDKGTVTSTDETGEKRFTVVGGNFDTEIKVNESGNVKDTTITAFTPNNDTENQYITSTVTVGDKAVIVVTKVDKDETIITEEGNSVIGAADNSSIIWKNSTTKEEELNANKTLHYLEINQDYNQKLTVKEGKTLTVERIVLGNKAKIVVEAGAKLIVTGEQGIVAPVESNIVLKANADKYAQFLFNPAVTSNRHPKATVELISDSYRVDANDRHNQHFGIPTSNKLTSIETDRTDHRVAFYRYDYSIDNWQNIGYLYPEQPSQADLDINDLSQPFEFYQMMCTSPTTGTKVTMKGELVGNDNQQMSYLSHFYMGFANSYTADIDLATILPTVPGANEAVYIYQKVGDNQYYWEPSSTAYLATTKIAPMQAFVILNRGAASTSILNYKNMVWDTRAAAPKRAITDYNAQCRLSVSGQNAFDAVTMIEDARFTGSFDRGEAEKYMNSNVNIYVTDEQPMGIYATDELNNAYVGFSCKQGGIYTLSFDKLIGNDLALIDLTSNKVINIEEGIQYQFETTDNETNDYRFQIIKRQEVPTDLESVNNNIKANGIYTITGQYMGNMSVWNTLPAGVYVVDGQKKVK